MAEHESSEKGQHQNIARATMVLDALAEVASTGLRLADVTRVTGLGKATAHRVLAGLVAHGLAEQDEENGCFYLGMRLVLWGAAAGNRFGLTERATPGLARLCQRTEDTVYLSLRSGDEAVCLDRYEGSYPIKTLTLQVGDRRPLGIGAGSLALLAFLPDEEIARILSANVQARIPYRDRIDELELREMIEAARSMGYALNDGKIIPGMSAVGVPICREDGISIASVSVAAISTRMQSPRRENIVSNIKQEVRQLEAELRPLLTRSFASQLTRISQGS